MNKVYRLVPDSDEFDSFVFPEPDDYDLLREEKGEPMIDIWRPPKVEFVIRGRRGDFPSLTGHFPAFSGRAKEELEPLIETDVEFLPLDLLGEQHWAVHILAVIDCLDFEHAEVEWFDEDRILAIDSYAFRNDVIEDRPLFRIAQQPLAFCYASEGFRKASEEAGLEGMIFEQVAG